MGGDVVSALTADLKGDAAKLAENAAVSPEMERKTIGRIGLLVCEISANLWSKDDLARVADAAAQKAVQEHVAVCSGGGGYRSLLRVLDKHFVHIWWGFIVLCLVFGFREVLDAVVAAWKAAG